MGVFYKSVADVAANCSNLHQNIYPANT